MPMFPQLERILSNHNVEEQIFYKDPLSIDRNPKVDVALPPHFTWMEEAIQAEPSD